MAKLPPVTVPVADAVPPVAKLPPVTVPVEVISPAEYKLPPVKLPVMFVLPRTLPTKLVVPLTTALPPMLALAECISAYPVIVIVVEVSAVLVKTVTNSWALSSHTKAIFSLVPR